MRSELVRVYKVVHTWTGILTGLALFIAFYAGALTMFKDSLNTWSTPAAVLSSTFSLAQAPEVIRRTLQSHPEAAHHFELGLGDASANRFDMSWTKRVRGREHDETALPRFHVVPEGESSSHVVPLQSSRVADFIDSLHRVVGLPVDTEEARWVMGIVSLAYCLAIFSGVIIILPTLVRDLFALRLGKNLKRMWMDAHNVVGILSLPFHVIMAVTAVGFAFHDGIYALQNRMLHDGKMANAWAAAGHPARGSRDVRQLIAPADLLARTAELSPGFRPSRLEYVDVLGPRAMVRVWGHDAKAISPRFMGGFVAMDPYSGKIITQAYLPGHQSLPDTVISSAFALHFGAFGGNDVRWMYFLLGIAGAWLFYSGNLLWIESRRKKAKPANGADVRPRRDVRFLANLTVGACLGCITGLSLTLVASRWLDAADPDLMLWHQLIYYAVFFGAIAWAFFRSAFRAGVELLWLAALSALSVPVSSLLLGSTNAVGVDLTGLMGAIALAWMALAMRRRMQRSAADGVWSVPAGRELAGESHR